MDAEDFGNGAQNKTTGTTGTRTRTQKKVEPIDGFNESEMALINAYNLYEIVKDTRAIVIYDDANGEIDYQEGKITALEQLPESKNRDRDIQGCLDAIAEARTIRDGIKEPKATSNNAVQNLRMLDELLKKIVIETETAIANSKTALSDESDESEEAVN